jgi:hypothetical protein
MGGRARRDGIALASSVKRAAALMASPITVYSKHAAAPTLPATTGPAETPIAAFTSGSSVRSRTSNVRAAASAPVAALGPHFPDDRVER